MSSPSRDDNRRRVFAVGLFRTGTDSITRLVAPYMKAAHEPHRYLFVQQWLRFQNGTLNSEKWDRFLQQRDRTLGLSFEASGFLSGETPRLARLFPEAKFILTVREPVSWIRSLLREILVNRERLGYHYYEPMFRSWFGQDSFPEEEKELERQKLYPVSGMLRYWKKATDRVLAHVPGDRLLVVSTERLTESAPRIAGFLDLRGSAPTGQSCHTHLSKSGLDPLRSIPQQHLHDSVETIAESTWKILEGVVDKYASNNSAIWEATPKAGK